MPSWDVIIDWSAVLAKLGLEPGDLPDLPKGTREQAVADVENQYGVDALFEKDPQEIDQIVADTLERILKKKNYFQKREKAKKQNANSMPQIEIFPTDGVPEEFKQLLQDALENSGTDWEKFMNDFMSRFGNNKPKSKSKSKDKRSKWDDDDDPSRSMFT